ncbi:unnamed protein product [Cyprideis torosa]|uniref:Adenosine kinase n=1 Tax=Cyprideis torosa TaxID=163714 RepID=A0A7R8ZUX0_9CRUS|nr:unnamed protein product [Cyprideis torosa]CAG0901691.1 unnamed protein product [Cyprideis torosa]
MNSSQVSTTVGSSQVSTTIGSSQVSTTVGSSQVSTTVGSSQVSTTVGSSQVSTTVNVASPAMSPLAATKRPVLLGVGNPLMDMLAPVVASKAGENRLEKYGLAADDQVEATKEQEPLLDELFNDSSTRFNPGGAVQNTLRVYEWLMRSRLGESGPPYKKVDSGDCWSMFIGGVGQDETAAAMQKAVESAGVRSRYAYHTGLRTGMCASLASGSNRSLVASIGASAVFTMENWKDLLQAEREAMDSIQSVYVEGFFLVHSPEVVLSVAKEFVGSNPRRTFIFNISAPFVVQVSETITQMNTLLTSDKELAQTFSD